VLIATLNKRDKKILTTFCTKCIDNASTIHTGCLKGYSGFFKHLNLNKTVNYSINFVDLQTGMHTNTIERN